MFRKFATDPRLLDRITKQMTRPVRGKLARFARCGNLAPFISKVGETYASFYELQQRTKGNATDDHR